VFVPAPYGREKTWRATRRRKWPLHAESGMEASGREGRDEAQKTAPFAERKKRKGMRHPSILGCASKFRCGVVVPAPYGREKTGCTTRHPKKLTVEAGPHAMTEKVVKTLATIARAAGL